MQELCYGYITSLPLLLLLRSALVSFCFIVSVPLVDKSSFQVCLLSSAAFLFAPFPCFMLHLYHCSSNCTSKLSKIFFPLLMQPNLPLPRPVI